jgi:hypothetical protein
MTGQDDRHHPPEPRNPPQPHRPLELMSRDEALSWFRHLLGELGRLAEDMIYVKESVYTMAVSVDELNSDIQTLVAGSQAKDALIKQLQDELAAADTNAQARVDAAVAAEDADAQSKIDAADAVVENYLNPAPAPDQPPADGG